MAALPFSRDAIVRCAPFALFMGALALRGFAPEDGSWGFDTRWIYGAGALGVAGLMALWWRDYGELARQNLPDARETALALAAGLAVFGLWIVLDAPWMVIGTPAAGFVPTDASGAVDWPLAAVRLAGAALVVPLMEELFWRSFLMRWIVQGNFLAVPPQRAGVKAVLLSTFVFTLAHTQWLAAAIAGLVYAMLYVRTGRLWVPVIAHAVTNAALGVWVLATQRWEFW